MSRIIVPGIAAGIAILAISLAISNAFMLIPAVNADYHSAALMRSFSDPIMMLYFAYPFVLGIALAWVWGRTKGLIKGSWAARGLKFGAAYLAVATIPGMLVSYSSFPLSILTIISWTLSGFVGAVAAGMIFAKMNK